MLVLKYRLYWQGSNNRRSEMSDMARVFARSNGNLLIANVVSTFFEGPICNLKSRFSNALVFGKVINWEPLA